MADCLGFQTQVASILELLANSAVAEICRLVDDGYAALRARVEQEREKSRRENDALRQRLREMDTKVRSYERRLRRRSQREDSLALHAKPLEEREDQQFPAAPEDELIHPVAKETQVFPLVKQEKEERGDCNLDLKVEVNIRADCGFSNGPASVEETCSTDLVLDTGATEAPPSVSQPSLPLVDATVDLTCRQRLKSRPAGAAGGGLKATDGASQSPEAADGAVKPELQTSEEPPPSQLAAALDSDEASAERLAGLDLAWMQERVSNLGAAYAVAQLGLGSGEPGHPSASFPAQADGLDAPPAVLFAGGAHEMAAFANSFDMVAASISAPPPAANSAPAGGQRRPYRCRAAASGEAAAAACGVCRRVFPSAAALELHQRAHTGERPYACPHCGKGFAQPNNLRVHLLVHTGERRYRCSLCGKSFISSSHLKRHRTVHTQEKPYSCSRCGQSFSQMCSVRRHRQQSQCGL